MFTKKFTFLLSGLCFFGLSHSLEVKPFGQFFLPADVTIAKDSKSVSSETEWETEYVIEAGLEALFPSEFLPMRSGFGLGFRTSQRVDDARATPASMPVWGVLSFGRIDRYAFFSPYFSMRGGYLMPLTGDDHWWERPVNFFVNWGVGTVLPKGFTLELSGDYSSMQKSYDDGDFTLRVSGFRFGILFGMNIEIFRSRIYKTKE